MAARPATGFDLGPLSWVKTEIDHSLGQARENLEKIVAAPGDRAPVKYILTHLHQATGAPGMVGLGAATRYNEELERLVSSIGTCDAAEIGTRVPAAKRAIALNQRLMGLHQKLFVEANPIPVKWALAPMGRIGEGIRLPLTPPAAAHHETVTPALRQAGCLP